MSMQKALTQDRVPACRSDGYLSLEHRIPNAIISVPRAEIARCGTVAAGRAESNDRLDLEASHHPDNPAAHCAAVIQGRVYP